MAKRGVGIGKCCSTARILSAGLEQLPGAETAARWPLGTDPTQTCPQVHIKGVIKGVLLVLSPSGLQGVHQSENTVQGLLLPTRTNTGPLSRVLMDSKPVVPAPSHASAVGDAAGRAGSLPPQPLAPAPAVPGAAVGCAAAGLSWAEGMRLVHGKDD